MAERRECAISAVSSCPDESINNDNLTVDDVIIDSCIILYTRPEEYRRLMLAALSNDRFLMSFSNLRLLDAQVAQKIL